MHACRILSAFILTASLTTLGALPAMGRDRSAVDPGTELPPLAPLQASIQRAGGTPFTSSEGASIAISYGWWTEPMLAVDLTGDGIDEVLLLQHGSKHDRLVATGRQGVLWSQKLPAEAQLAGTFTGDLARWGGDEVLLVFQRWSSGELLLGTLGQAGLQWTREFPPPDWVTLNGLVETDEDGEREIALSVYDEAGFHIEILDGETGLSTSQVSSSQDDALGASGFVTDGPDGEADEAVFVSQLGWGPYYAERISLADGTQTASEIIPNVRTLDLEQGPDYTGDGRRDATITSYLLSPAPSEVAVLDAETLAIAWSKAGAGGQSYAGYNVLPIGDANGDGGQDLCMQEHSFPQEDDPQASLTLRCLSGKTGSELWAATRTAPGNNAFVYATSEYDLDGDAVVDPIIQAYGVTCDEEPEACQTTTAESTSVSGRTGAPLWTVSAWEGSSILGALTTSDLDGIPGDDGLSWALLQEDPFLFGFGVRNGKTLQTTWKDTFLQGKSGFPAGAIGAQLDQDPTLEVVMVGSVYEIDPDCRRHCQPIERLYLSAFEPGGPRLWELGL